MEQQLSPSTKSDFASAPRPNKWRLKRTLKREVNFRPIEDEDIRYAFAAYRKTGLATLGEVFADGKMGADKFKEAFEQAVINGCNAAWTLFAGTGKGTIPIGIVFAAFAPGGTYMVVNGMTWFPWASPRNMIEAMVNFLNGVRKQVHLMFYATPEHRKMYEVCAMHGVVRRVGTSYVAVPGQPATVFETRAA